MLLNVPETIKLLCIVLVVNLPESQQKACGSGWFGEKCRFQCHCRPSPSCAPDGKCLENSRCAKGYFGPACQYVDLAEKARADTASFAIDGDENTCNTNSKASFVRVVWDNGITFNWFRLHVNKPGNLNSFKVKLNETIDCPNERKFAVSETSVDVTCHVNFSVLAVEVIGAVAPDVCSIYISGGRNVALKQITNQTSTQYNETVSQSSNAVDGIMDSNYESGHCSGTIDSKLPKWNLYFDQPYIIHEIIIHNMMFYADIISGFDLKTYDTPGNIRFFYTERRPHTLSQYVIQFPSHAIVPITMINIVKRGLDVFGNKAIVMCELQAFGEAVCPEGYYGLTCNKRCACHGSEVCFTVTGACSPGCPLGAYGSNCALRCNRKCKHLECQQREGGCVSCHDGYIGKYCDQVCKYGTYGPGCALNCSKNCVHGCDRGDGFCHCRHPFVGPTCSECPPPFYGDNCTKKCPSNCALSKCKFDTGQCISCPGARSGIYCRECPPRYYGTLCFKECSRFCHNETCDATTGNCSPCTDHYTGRSCTEAPVSMPWLYLITAMVVSTLLSFVITWVYIRRAIKRDGDNAADSDISLSSSDAWSGS